MDESFEIQEGKIEKNPNIRSGYYYRNRKKPIIKFLVVTKFGTMSQRHDIAFLTSDAKFYYTSIKFKQLIHHMSWVQHKKIRDIFKNFEIDETTEIVIQDTVDQHSPLMIFFNTLKPYLNFWMTTVSLTQIVSRICYKHQCISKRLANKTAKVNNKNVTMFLARAWNKLVEIDACPWISKAINDSFKLYSDTETKYQIRARVCLYYMIIRRYYVNNNRRCELKKQQIDSHV